MGLVSFLTGLFKKEDVGAVEAGTDARPVTAIIHMGGDSVFFCRSNEADVVARAKKLAALHPEVELQLNLDDKVAFSAPFEWAKVVVPFADGEVEF